MHETTLRSPPRPDFPVWHALSQYTVGPDDAALSFVVRLARENGWRDDYAQRVFEEYRRFCLLAVVSGEEVTPSDAVDQAWHLHLTYSRDYWERFCPQVLGRSLHHGPTAGGRGEQDRYFEQYARTLRAYEALFGLPPADIWPDARRRFGRDPQARRVHLHDTFILSRRAALSAAALAVTLILGAFLLGSLV